jgi:signal transduction histidine kinase
MLLYNFGEFGMRLSSFINENTKVIIKEWENFAKTLMPAADNMSQLQLNDHIDQLLFFIAKDIESVQSSSQEIEKSHGESDNSAEQKDSAAEMHADLRQDSGFGIVQMVAEYRALRSSIVRLWIKYKVNLDNIDVEDLTRFNEAIDQALTESIARFEKKVNYSKDLILGVLGHDIRSPLSSINMSAEMMSRVGEMNEKQLRFSHQIQNSSMRISKIVADLIDLTCARMGAALPVNIEEMDIEVLAEHIVEEILIQNPHHIIKLRVSGKTKGQWDRARLGQLFSNLINNSVQYGSQRLPITVTIKGNKQQLIIAIHNEGNPIPSNQRATMFDSFTRGKDKGKGRKNVSSNLGLGLFITQEIVRSHGGTITVISNENDGTTFTVCLPRINRVPK